MALRASDIDALLSPAPVQSRPRGLRASDIDALIGAPTLNARASGSAGAVNKKAEAIWGGSFDDWKKRKEADDAERARMVAESEAGNVGSRRAQEFQRETATLAETGALRNKPGEFNFGATGQMMRAGAERAMGGALRFAGESAAPVVGLMDAARNPEAFVRGTTDRGEIPSNAVLAAGQDNALANAGSELAATGATRARRAQPLLIDRPDDALSVDGLKYYAQQGAISAPQLATTVAAGYLGGPAAALLAAGGAAFGTKFADARDENQDFSQAASGALVTAANEAIPEMLPAAAALGKLSRFMPDWMADGIVSRLVATGVAEGSTEGITEVANIAYETFGENKPMDRATFVNRVKDAVITGGLAGSMVGAVTGTAEYGQARDEVRDDAMIRSLRAAIKPRITTARILGPTATPDAAAGAQIADDAFRAAGVGTVAAADMAEQDALSRDLDAAQRDQLLAENDPILREVDARLVGSRIPSDHPLMQGSPNAVAKIREWQAGRIGAGAAIPGISGSLPVGVRASYPGDSAESGSSVGFVGDGGIGSRNAPAPQQFTELANGTIFVPGDPVQLRQRAADAGFDVRGLAETRNGVTGVRFGTGARDQIIGLFGGADPASAVEQSQPSAPPEAAAVIAPPALDAKRTYGDTVFDERAHDLLDFIALNGGLDRTALESEGIDPASWNSRAAKGKNERFFGKPLFRKSGGMSLETLREKARDAGFRTDKDVLDLIGDSLGGRKTFTPAGSEYQMALADVARQEADAQARQQRVNALPPSVPETDADAYIASRETEFDAPADRDGIDLADIESTLSSVSDTSPEQRASTQSLGGDYTAKLLQYKKDRRAWGLNPQQEQEYQDLLELDRETGKVGGRPMVGVRNKTAYVDALDAGELLPVQGFTDADDFKTLNDKLGHAAGDDAIREIGDALVAEFGEGNVFHRSGDEFLFQGTDQADVDAKMQRVRDRLSQITLRATDASGNVQEQRGIGLSYGTGTDEASADAALVADKQRRKESGQRVGQRRTSDHRGVGEESAGEGIRSGEGRGDSAAEGVGDARRDPSGSVPSGTESAPRVPPRNWLTGQRTADQGDADTGNGQGVGGKARPSVQSIRAAISQALGPKFLARLDNQRWFQIVDTVADLPPDVRKSITGGGIAGFVLGNRVYVVAEDAAGNPVGVLLHELGVHYGMTGILGDDFAPTLAKFKRLRAKDDRVGRAYERATEAADKDANGELTEAAKATLDEEALAYFVEENWDSPDTRGIVAKVIDAIKRLLNRLGMPLSMVNASPELLREVAIGAARMAADGRVSVGKDGALVYARDLLGEAPSETAQLVAQWKAKVDAKLRGDGRAYVKPSEGPGDLFGGPAEETSDLFAKPQQRAQGVLFSRKRDNSTAAEDRALDSGDLEGAVRIRNRRIAEQREALGDISNGVILKMEGRDSWAIVMPDVEGGGKWRMQMFDRRGFVGHRTRNSSDAALDEALQDKYTTRDDGALDEIQDSPEFVRGNFIAGEMMQLNAGKITSDEFDKRIADYDSSVKVVAKYSRKADGGSVSRSDKMLDIPSVEIGRGGRAPAGGIYVSDRFYDGGEFLPEEYPGGKSAARKLAAKVDGNIAELRVRPASASTGAGKAWIEVKMAGQDRFRIMGSSPFDSMEKAIFVANEIVSERDKYYQSRGVMPHPTEVTVAGDEQAQAPKFSRRTITINGTERPTTDSTGKAIHPTEEGVRKFWEWFGSSKITDQSAAAKARDDVRAAQSKLDFDDSRLASLADTHPLHPIITRSRAKHATELDDAKSYLAAVQSSAPPVQVFHGGGGHIDAFRRKSRAIWMAEAVAANTYGDGVGGAVYPLYARIENPMTFDADGATWQQLEFEGERVSTDDLADIAESRGHDGLIINNLRDEDTDDGGDTPATHYAVFAPEQVKSATGNTGAFSPTDPRIAYSRKTEEPEGLPPPVAIESHLSNMLKLRAFFDSAVDVMARQPGLKPLADAVRSYFDNVRRRQGLVNEVLRAPVKAASKADLDAFERYQYALQNNLRDDVAEELAGMTDKGRALVSAWEKIAKLTNDENQKVGVQVFDPKIGGWRKIGTARNFFPRVLKPKFQEAMRQPHKYPAEWNRLVRILLDAGRIQSAEDAQEFLNTAFSNESAFEYFAGIEKARMEPLPRDLYDYSMDAAIGYKDAWADRLSQIEAFGQKIGQGDQAKDKFDEVLMTVTDDNTRNYVTRVRERITNTNSKSPFYKFMANMNTLVTGLMLGNPATAALNIVGGLSNNAMVFPLGPNLRALKELRNLGAGIRDAVAKGVLIDDYMGVSADAAAQGVSERLSNLTQGLLNWGGYNGTEYINRVHSMLVGKHFLSDSLAAINKNPRSRKSLLATAFLQRNGFDVDTLAAESTKPADERPETNKFLRFASNLTQGSYKIDQTPIFVDEPIGKFLFKYQKFGTQINRVFYQQVLKPFAQSVFKGGEPVTLKNADGTEAQERVRNFVPLLRFIAAAIPGGMLVQFIREALFGYGEDGPDEDEIRRKLADGETAAAAAMLAERAFIAITALGAGGFLGNYMQTAKDFQERQRFKNPLDPPGLAPVKSFANFVMKLNDQGKITLDDIEQEIQNNVSLYRTGKRLLSSGINMINDESVAFAAREAARREHNHVRYMARRYADSVGIEAKRRAPSEIAATANTPTNRAIKDALLLGDGETARALAAEYVASFDNAYDAANALASIRNSIRLGQPALVQLAPSETERRRFMRWAFSNLTPEGYARIKDTDEKYRKAAASSGLWKPESDAAAMKRDRKADESKAQWSDSQRNSFLRSKGLKR